MRRLRELIGRADLVVLIALGVVAVAFWVFL
jgi:hypothetical protein